MLHLQLDPVVDVAWMHAALFVERKYAAIEVSAILIELSE